MNKYLAKSKYIDWDHPKIFALAKELSAGLTDETAITKKCFEWVRDEIKHTSDCRLRQVTLKASEALEHCNGYCYSKSHLLAALLRANGIPAGLCYQRVCKDEEKGQFCLHGLNSVDLKEFGWYRIDPRGNKDGVNAQFAPPEEQLAFKLNRYEKDIPGIFDEPLPEVVEALTKYSDAFKLYKDLPDKS